MHFKLFCALLIFLTSAASAQTPAPSDQPAGYLIGPGDVVTGKVLGEPQFDFETAVDENGRLQVPFVDTPVNAKCMSEPQLRTEVAKLLSKYLRNPQVNVRVTDRKSRPPATVYGEVRTPQQVVLTRPSTMLELIAFSGGTTEDAGGMIQIFRTHPPVCSENTADAEWNTDGGLDVPSRMYSLGAARLGGPESNPVIYPGDMLLVQKASPVYVTGEVMAPQGLFLKEGGLSLTEAIAKIGGVRREAKTKDIKIYRLKPNSKDREIITANFDAIRRNEQKDVMLQPYDIVEVDKSKKSIAQTVLELVAGTARTAVGGFGNALPTRILY